MKHDWQGTGVLLADEIHSDPVLYCINCGGRKHYYAQETFPCLPGERGKPNPPPKLDDLPDSSTYFERPGKKTNKISDPDVPELITEPLELNVEPLSTIPEDEWEYFLDLAYDTFDEFTVKSNLELVRDWHKAFGAVVNDTPTLDVDQTTDELRLALIEEELLELRRGLAIGDLVNVAKELADLVWVVYGAAVTYGIPLDKVFRAVYDSNMSKLGADGKPVLRSDGKILKGPNYTPAEEKIKEILNESL